MAIPSKVVLGDRAYVKSVLHPLKHKTSSVNGILVGHLKDDDSLQILDSFPLFHTHLALLPMLELSLLQIEEYIGLEDSDLQIVGYYHANERFDDSDLNPLARKIGDHIIRYCPQAVILVLDNKQLASLPGSNSQKPVFQLYTRDSGKAWKQAGSSGAELTLKGASANNLIEAYLAEGRVQNIVDFDDHLDDVTKDWTNRAFFD